MKRVWQISVYALIFLGILHVAFTPKFYSKLDVDAIWFISCGFLLIFQGFVNILAWILQKKIGHLLAIIANLISLLLVLALLFILGEIQAYIGTLLALLALSGSLYFYKKVQIKT